MLKETKFYFENLFATLWTNTPIHYAGQEFDATGIQRWINPTITPLRNRFDGLGKRKLFEFNLYIPCWAENDVESMQLADEIALFVNDNVDGSLYHSNGYDIIDHGWQDSNQVFTVLSFRFKAYDGLCDGTVAPPPPCANSVGNVSGTEYNVTGIWKKDCIIFKA